MALFTGHTITSDSALGSAVIKRSLRIDQGVSDLTGSNYSRTFGSGNRKTFTISVWVKKCNTPGNIGDGDDQYSMISAGGGGSGASAGNFFFYNDDTLRFTSNPQPSVVLQLITNRRFRDDTSWYHLMAVLDTTQATESNRAKIYVNGVQETSFSTATYPSQDNTTVYLNGAFQHRVGSNSLGSNIANSYGNFNGYLAEFNFIDGQALDPSSFGFTDPQTGIWMPKRYEGTYGTNGFYLDFTDNTSTTTLGIDKSPNGNDFTPEDVDVTDCVLDTPSNNFATWNVEDGEGKDNSGSFSEGNLKVQIAYQGNDEESGATLAFSSGKWYWEEYMQASTADASMVGVGVKSIGGIYANNGNHWRVRGGGGESDHNGSQTNVSGFSWTTGDIIGIAVDMDAGTWTASKNGTWIGANIHTNISGTVTPTMHNSNGSERHTFITNFGQDSSFAGTKTAQGYKDSFGIGDFYYPVPSGYRALCSKNLPPNVPSVVKPQKHFECVTFTGNGSTGQSITSLEFQPDFIWFKNRSAGNNHASMNSVIGRSKGLYPDSNSIDFNSSAGRDLVSFAPSGFTVGNPEQASSTNNNGSNLVAWCWKAGGATTVSNSDGSITSSVSANPIGGFSIIQYTGTGSAATIGHGLGKAPKLIWVKNRTTTQDWFVNNGMIFNDYGKYYKLNSSQNVASDTNVFPNTAPTSTVFSVGGDNAVNGNGDTYVAYVWSEIPGFSQFGYWTGNGSTDGTYVHTGFTPRMMIYRKAVDENWHILDTQRDPNNPNKLGLDPNLSNAEADDSNLQIDFLGSGFKMRASHGTSNGDDVKYFYYTWAGQPGTTPFGTFPNSR